MSKNAKAAAPASPAPALTAVRRTSRLPVEAVLAALRGAGPVGLTVPFMAESLQVAERDVRLSIDALRVKKFAVVRSALKTFALSA